MMITVTLPLMKCPWLEDSNMMHLSSRKILEHSFQTADRSEQYKEKIVGLQRLTEYEKGRTQTLDVALCNRGN